MGCSLGMGHNIPEHHYRHRDQWLCLLAIPKSCLLEILAPAAPLQEEPWEAMVLQRELTGVGVT